MGSLFGKLLPKDFKQKSATINQYQHFFQSQTSDAVYQMVDVLNVTQDCLTVSVPSPALLNYLRLHSQQIRDLISEQFGHYPQLKIKVIPETPDPDGSGKDLKPARHFSPAVCDQIIKSAGGLQDEELREAMISLANTIKD